MHSGPPNPHRGDPAGHPDRRADCHWNSRRNNYSVWNTIGTARRLAARRRLGAIGASKRGGASVAVIATLILLALGPGRFLTKASAQYPVLQGYAEQWEAAR